MSLNCLLALDCAGGACSAAVWRDGAVRARRLELMTRGHAERLVPMIDAVMGEAAVGFADLEAVAVTVGPGGFTGVRIGLATARGLALAAGLPILGVSNFRAVAAAVPEAEWRNRELAVLIDAKRAEVYLQVFGAGLAPRAPPVSIRPEGLAGRLGPGATLFAGDAIEQCRPVIEAAWGDSAIIAAPGHADAAWVARLAQAMPRPAAGTPPPEPLYLRAPDTTKPGKRA